MNLQQAYELVCKAKTPEDVFGDAKDATDINNQYKKLVMVLHPDKYRKVKEKQLANEVFPKLTAWAEAAKDKLENGTYGNKNVLVKPVVITTKKNTYTIHSLMAGGDICEVYAATQTKGKDVVLKVPRVAGSNVYMANEAEKLRSLQDNKMLSELAAFVHLPTLVDSFELQQKSARKRVNVLVAIGNAISLADVMQAYPKGINVLDAAWMFNRILGALVVAHQGGLVHGAILPEHVLVNLGTHNGVLIDWTASVRQGEVIKIISKGCRHYYPPEVLEKKPATQATDIYMAASCLLGLIGGNVMLKTFPAGLHHSIQGLLRACWLPKAHRISNAYELHEDFGEVTGPRRFRPFAMPAGWTKK